MAAASARPQTINYELPGGQATLTLGPSSAPAPAKAQVVQVAQPQILRFAQAQPQVLRIAQAPAQIRLVASAPAPAQTVLVAAAPAPKPAPRKVQYNEGRSVRIG